MHPARPKDTTARIANPKARNFQVFPIYYGTVRSAGDDFGNGVLQEGNDITYQGMSDKLGEAPVPY